MWTIKRIEEADYGCEERMPGEPLLVLVTLENEMGQQEQLQVADRWLLMQELDEGDEWPEDFAEMTKKEQDILEQAQWMEGYLEAVEELEQEETNPETV